ncbi:DUF2955 domain-containing protein [Vibrio agarivorans]|uniref:DUF2955 domain-containing protein n=1 Tax=Vibrio agarivorans TaxID=153622 RepID=A0ABT7Y6Y5_9VIBR|nr:DUF2955 domain-containing protein [Vibrio agarivorans]MDN2483710.1 DUF2955 domain-containing protein [Vibrio agarivorans]
MQDNLAAESEAQRRTIRFIVGVGIAVFAAAYFNWSLAFVAPVFTAKFLIEKPSLNSQTVYELVIALVVTMFLGMMLTGGITQYPLILMLLVGLMMLWGYYLFTDPKWNLFASILLIAVLLLPFMAISNPSISFVLAKGLSFSGIMAILVFALVHILIPEHNRDFKGYAQPQISDQQRWHAAFRAMILAFPVVCFFYVFQITSALLTMIFIAILSLQITGEKSIKLSAFLVFSNAIGGVLATIMFSILTVVPNLIFYTLVTCYMAAVMGNKIYTIPAKAPVYVTAFSTFLVLVGNTVSSTGGDIDSNTWVRILQLVMVGLYMIVASFYLETRDWKFLRNQHV